MGGLLAITAPAVVSGVLAVVPTFLLLGWDAQDRRETCARWARRFRAAFEGLLSRACALARGRLCPASAAELPVTLGEVSEMVDIVRLGLSAGSMPLWSCIAMAGRAPLPCGSPARTCLGNRGCRHGRMSSG